MLGELAVRSDRRPSIDEHGAAAHAGGPGVDRDHAARIVELVHQRFLRLDDLVGDRAALDLDGFPSGRMVGGVTHSLDYEFDPASPGDGVTVDVPVESLHRMDPAAFDWLVPGLLRDKITALIRQLPKPMRRSLTPAPNFADALSGALRGQESKPLRAALAAEIRLDADPLRTFTDPDVGDYHRIVLPGTYSAVVSGPGWIPSSSARARRASASKAARRV